MEDTNLNINNNECIKERAVWGGTEYINICTQETSVVQWGIDVWLGGGIFIIFITALLLYMIWVLKQ